MKTYVRNITLQHYKCQDLCIKMAKSVDVTIKNVKGLIGLHKCPRRNIMFLKKLEHVSDTLNHGSET